jgi:hypothetical protein
VTRRLTRRGLRVAEAAKLEMTEAAHRSNPAVISAGAAMVKLHGPLPVHAPVHPLKRDLLLGAAWSVTALPRRNE